MCGRYVMARAVGDLVAEAGAEDPGDLALPPSWNIAPTSDVAVVLERLVEGEPARQVHVARWGLVPGWATDPAVGVRAFNARSETAAEKPTFRRAAQARRCAVPAEGYFEWHREGTGRGARKTPHYVHPADGSLLFFAGLYEWWRDPAREAGDPGRWLLSTSILTMPSPPEGTGDPVLDRLATLHDRVPLPLSRDGMDAWLDPGEREPLPLIGRAVAEAPDVARRWDVREVGPAVGNVRNDGPELIEPAGAPEGPGALF